MEWRYRSYRSLDEQENSQWKPVTIPRNHVAREFQGFIEYETSFDVQAAGKELGIYLGEIGDADKVYINDVLIGQTGDFPPNYSYNMDVDRHYFIPATVLKPGSENKLKVIAYSKYFVNKGLDTDRVIISENSILHHKKYSKEILDNFSKIIIPLLCLILAVISLPPFAPKALWGEQMIIFLMGISSFVFGVCRGRIGFHFFDMLLTYKATIISSIITIWLIAVSSIGIRTKKQKIWTGILSLVASGLIFALLIQNNLIVAGAVAKAWFHIAPFFLFAGIVFVFKDRSKNVPLKVGLVILFFADLNDVLHDLKIISSISLLQAGLGSFVLLLIMNQINRLRKSWESFFKKEFELEADARLGRQAIQLAHDIRSPLEALKSAKDEIAKLPEMERASINLAIGRIEEIAYNLLLMRKNSNKNQGKGHTHVKSTLWQIVQEKKLQYRNQTKLAFNFTSDKESFGSFSGMETETFKRIISNLLDNAAEAVGFGGEIEVKLMTHGQTFKIEVIDSGPLIPLHDLQKIFEKGFTTKGKGNGLGLYHAKKEIEAIKGTISFTQKDKTVVEILLPLGERPTSFAAMIDLTNINRVIILDDDESIHQVWKKKFKNHKVELEHFYKALNLLSVYKDIPEDCLLLSDFELLGEELNGIDCINQLNSARNSILVTARADEPQIAKNCEQFGIKILPKSMAHEIEVKVPDLAKSAVLIDDDIYTQMTWKLAARKADVSLTSFCSVEEFIQASSSFRKDDPIYIDSNLGPDLKGEVLSEEIFKMGFTNLYVATGYLSQDVVKPSWIKDVLGKRPPFECSKN